MPFQKWMRWLFHFPNRELMQHLDEAERKHQELGVEIKEVRKRLDPLKDLIENMEKEFKKDVQQ